MLSSQKDSHFSESGPQIRNNVIVIANAQSFWTSAHVVILLDGLLTAATLVTAVIALLAVRGSESQLKLLAAQVKVEQDQLDQQKSTLLASVMPIIADVPLGGNVAKYIVEGTERFIDLGEIVWGTRDGEDVIKISVPFRNIGSGPAFIHKIVFTPSIGLVVEGMARGGVAPVGEVTCAYHYFTEGDQYHSLSTDWLATGRMKVGILYADIGMQQRFQSVLDIGPLANHKFMVEQVLIYRCDSNWVREASPFVESGGGWMMQQEFH